MRITYKDHKGEVNEISKCGLCRFEKLMLCDAKDETTGKKETFVCLRCKQLNFY